MREQGFASTIVSFGIIRFSNPVTTFRPGFLHVKRSSDTLRLTTLTTVRRVMSADLAPVAWIIMLVIGIDTSWSVIWAFSTIYTTYGAELKLLSTEAVLLKPNTLNQRTPGQTVFFVRAQSALHKLFFRRGNLPICAQFLNSSCLLNLRVVWPDTCNDVSKSS
jgi:hypothetical protein